MAEQSNIFKKLDEIKSGIDEIKAPVQDETKLKEFIANAERVYVYCGQKSEYTYDKRSVCVSRIVTVILLLINVIVMAFPIIIYRDNANIFCIPFAVVAVFNVPYGAFTIVKLLYIKGEGYEVAYDKIKVPWMFYLYDVNGIICDEKVKLPYITVMMLKLPEILFSGLVFGCVAVLALVFIFLELKEMNGYILYFRDKNNIIPYSQLSKFMSDNNLK